jgi:hypothetical protein
MKKGLLFAIGISAAVSAFAQSNRQLVAHKPDLTLSSISSTDAQAPSFYTTAHNQRNGNPAVQMTGQYFSSSRNAYTLLVSQSNCMTANQSLGIALFTHRISADWSPAGVNSGYIQGSWYNGTAWDSMYFENDGVQLFRYPSGCILNGAGNTTVTNAWMAIAGPFTPGAGWAGYYLSAAPFASQIGNTAMGVNVASLNSFPRIDMASYSDSTCWVTGALLGDDDIAGSPYRGASLNKGTWDGTQVTWTMDSIKPTFHTDGAGATDTYQNTHLAFSANGQNGYCVFFGVQAAASTIPTRSFNPIVYSTTDGGATWSSVWAPFDYTTIPAINDKLYAYNGNGDVKPWFSQSNGSDMIVDNNNQLHIICTIESGFSDDDDSLSFFAVPAGVTTHYIYDVYTTGTNTWDAILIDSLLTSATTTQSPFSDGSAAIDIDARLQASVSPSRDHIFYLWVDTDPSVAGGENAYPNMYGVGVDWSTGARTAKKQFTFSDDAYFHYNSNLALVSGSTYQVPSTNSRDRDQSFNTTTTFDHYYLNNVTFDESEFVIINVAEAATSFGTISAYPNPATDAVNLNVNLNNNEKVTVNMVNLLGETVSSQQYTMNAGSNNIQLSTYNLEAGVYMISVSTGESTVTTRVVVQ